MAIRKCQNCGALLPDARAEDAVKCNYCGAVNRPHATVVQRVVLVVRGGESAGAGRRIAGLVAVLVVLGILATIGIVLWRVLALPSSSTTIGPPPGPRVKVTRIQAAPGSMLVFRGGGSGDPFGGSISAPGGATVTETEVYGSAKLTRADIAGSVSPLYTEVDPAGLAAAWPRFDPLAALPWMTETARAWSGDARLVGLKVDRVRDDGTVDCAGSSAGSVEYSFASAAHGAPSSPSSGLTFLVSSGRVNARTARPAAAIPTSDAPGPDCGTARIVAALHGLGLPAASPCRLSFSPSADGSWRWATTAPGKGRLEITPAAACP